MIIAVVVLGIYSYTPSETVYNAPEQIKVVTDEYQDSIEKVMSREDFKRQQELLAKEIYLKEEKSRIQTEYNAKLSKIEKDLESVRSEKITF